MAKLYLSFLGTSDYVRCIYRAPDGEHRTSARFVQEATVRYCCRDWTGSDRILIFTTNEANRKNWLDDGHVAQDGQSSDGQGLKMALKSLGLNCTVECVKIPEGKSEEELWRIFEILYGRMEPEAQVVFDITHAFRSIPMLAMAVMNYAKVLKRISVLGIYYGAFEFLGVTPAQAKMMQ